MNELKGVLSLLKQQDPQLHARVKAMARGMRDVGQSGTITGLLRSVLIPLCVLWEGGDALGILTIQRDLRRAADRIQSGEPNDHRD